MDRFVVGIDVGTGSARAGLFSPTGSLLATAVEPIQMWTPRPDFAEQSSEDIWRAVSTVTRKVVMQAGVAPDRVVGIAFDATCSLVVLDHQDRPLTVDQDGDPQRNIIVWMDHRAMEQAARVNATSHDVLRYVGGTISPEMEVPKLLWLKENLPNTWRQASRCFDLADFLTYRATGKDVRSLCTTVCKWTYLGHEQDPTTGAQGRWASDLFDRIGLSDLLPRGLAGSDIRSMGSPVGPLTPESAHELGLTTNCVVGVGIIDAHAGGIGVLGAVWREQADADVRLLETALALIGGTSNCHMAVSREPKYVPGVWGPYFSAMVPGLWLTEGGQSTAGSAIDYIITDHAAAQALRAEAEQTGKTVYQLLNEEILRLQVELGLPYAALLTREVHLLPYLLGNRSPHADPHARGILDGISLDVSRTSQAIRYYAAIQAIAYGTRDIVRAMNEAGYQIDALYVTGGAVRNPVWLQEHADATGLKLVVQEQPESVLLGSAILAAHAAEIYADIPSAMKAMSGPAATVRPNSATHAYHQAKFQVFQSLYREQCAHRQIMAPFTF